MAKLSFSTHFPERMGKQPTDFIQKIWKGLPNNIRQEYVDYFLTAKEKGITDAFCTKIPFVNINPKLHTIRADKKNRWKVDDKIHMVVFNRTKNEFRFAPVLEVKGIQRIEIKNVTEDFFQLGYWYDLKTKQSYQIKIDGKKLTTIKGFEDLALNDGFESVEQFFQWFNEDFTGKIIHWTELKY